MKNLNKLENPLIQGGMGVGISMGGLAGAVAAQGGMGVISTACIGFRESDFSKNPVEAGKRALKKEIEKARKIAKGRGLIAINAMVATSDFETMVKTACECDIDAVISGAGLPLTLPKITAGYKVLIAPIVSGAKAVSMIKRVWKKHYDREPDFLVCESSQAGGHLGFSEEDALFCTDDDSLTQLSQVIKEAGDIPVFSAGGVFDAEDIRRRLKLGAKGVQIGTRFIACEECDATQGFKDVILESKQEDIFVLKSPVGMPGRGLKTHLMKEIAEKGKKKPERCRNCIVTCNPAETPYCISNALIEAYYGNRKEGLFFCGSNAGRVKEMTTVKKLIEELSSGWSKR